MTPCPALALSDRGSMAHLADAENPVGKKRYSTVRRRRRRKRMTSEQFRSLLGYQRLKSTRFNWVKNSDHVTFEGVGLGHGVGMCQWGARYLAQRGLSYRQILNYYYPHTQIYAMESAILEAPTQTPPPTWTPPTWSEFPVARGVRNKIPR